MINKAILVGRLGADPEVRFTPSGVQVTQFRMVTEDKYTKEGEKVVTAEWHRIVTWKKLAEICANLLAKGHLVYVEGQIKTRSWEDREGIKRFTTEIHASTMQLLTKANGRPTEEGPRPEDDDEVPF